MNVPGFPASSSRGFLGCSVVALVRSRENIVFDTGSFGERQLLLSRIAGLGIAPEDIGMVVLSHAHYDDVLNWPLFPTARVVMSREEYRWASAQKDLLVPEGLIHSLNSHRGLRLVSDGEALCPWVKVLHVPGHTPGSMALLVERRKDRLVLAGDAVKNRAELSAGKASMAMDEGQAALSISRIAAPADCVLPGHDTLLRVRGGHVRAVGAARFKVVLSPGVKTRGKIEYAMRA